MHMGRVKNIEVIQKGYLKIRAEVIFEEGKINNQKTEAQAIPLLNNILVCIILDLNRKEILECRKQYVIKLFNILKEANKVLLFRQIRNTGAKTVHIFKNSNRNNKSFAVVTFRSKRVQSKQEGIV